MEIFSLFKIAWTKGIFENYFQGFRVFELLQKSKFAFISLFENWIHEIISISSQEKFTRKKGETRQIPYRNSSSLISKKKSIRQKRNSQNYFQRTSEYYNSDQNSPSFLFLKIEYTIISISFFLLSQGKFTRKKGEMSNSIPKFAFFPYF